MADKDEWLDDFDSTDNDLDQDNIDDLLSALDTEDNDLPAETGEKISGELDQANIDALLGLNPADSDSQDPGAEAGLADLDLDQDNIDKLLSGTGYDADAGGDFNLDELEQDNIDALLAGTSSENALDADSEMDLDQYNTDSLFESKPADSEKGDDFDELFTSDDDEPAIAAQVPASTDLATSEDLDQDNIDALLDNIDTASDTTTDTSTPKKDNSLDALFASDQATQEPPETTAEKVPGELSPLDADDLTTSAFDAELDDMDQLFAGIDNDIEDDDPFQAEEIDFAEMLGQTEGEDQEFIELDADDSHDTDKDTDDFMALAGAEDDTDIEAAPGDEEKKKKATGLMIPAALTGINKSTLAGMGGAIVLLLLFGLYFLFSGPKDTMETAKKASVPVQQIPARKVVENFIPVTKDTSFAMGKEGGEVAIELTALDRDDQPLIYEITSQPLHGRLSGTAPRLTYLPDNTFPGEDRFEFTATDGVDTSNLAVITITGPDLATLARAKKETVTTEGKREKKIFKPQKPKVLAKDVTYFTTSTGAVTIDWSRLWQEANSSAYAPQAVHVEIVDTAMKGSLKKGDRTSHIFTPDPYEASTDTIRYRFKKGGFRSATKTVTINIELGSPAPEINIATLADGYLVGQTVIVDASGSRDEARESLQFFWDQAAGVQIDLQPMNAEGSKISFTMPSSFYTDPNPDPIIVVTALDNTGKEVDKKIKVKMVSRRQTALWRGDNGTVATDPPMEGRYFPWPFDD